jgi:hypothetical protein
MGTSFHITDTGGSPITNATLNCGAGCTVSNAGSGFYYTSNNLDATGGAVVISAPGKMPTVETWWTRIFNGGNVALQDIKPPDGKW